MNTNNKPKPYERKEVINTLPTDVSAERLFIACLLESPRLMPDALDLLGSGEVLTHEAYKILFSALNTLYSEGRQIRLMTVLQHLNSTGETGKLQEMGINLIDLPAEAHVDEFADTCVHLRGLWVKRLALESAQKIITSVRSGDTAGIVVDVLSQAAEAVSSGLSVGSDPSISDSVKESLMAIANAMDKPGTLTGVNTGLGKLNKGLGGWQDSDVIMIAGRPGMGKSVAGLFHSISAAEDGVPVAFLSLEMPTKAMINRLIASKTEVEYGRMKKGQIAPHEITLIHHAAGQIERLPIYFYDDYNRDINDITYKLLHWKKKYGIGLVVIDYVQLMTDRTIKSSSEYEILTSVSKKLKQLQRRLGIPIIELAQLNRSIEGRMSKRASMSDLRNTGQFEQDASVIIMLYRDDYYKEKAAKDLYEQTGEYIAPVFDYELEYGIVKNRDGDTATAVFWADVATNRIADENPNKSWYQPTDDVKF